MMTRQAKIAGRIASYINDAGERVQVFVPTDREETFMEYTIPANVADGPCRYPETVRQCFRRPKNVREF